MLGDYRLEAQDNTRHRYVILLLHDGGPEDLSLSAVARFLASELSSRRAVDALPRWVWTPLLYGLVLPWRTPRARRMYAASWLPPITREPPATPAVPARWDWAAPVRRCLRWFMRSPAPASAASPPVGAAVSVHHGAELAQRVQQYVVGLHRSLLEARGDGALAGDTSIQVGIAYTHQHRSIEKVLAGLRLLGNYTGVRDSSGAAARVEEEHLIVLPLYPQYSSLRSAAAFDALVQAPLLREQRTLPHLQFIRSYATHPAYVKALEVHIRSFLGTSAEGVAPDWLFIVFDGLARRHVSAGDVYEVECQRTYEALKTLLTRPYVSPTGDVAADADGDTTVMEMDAVSSTMSDVSRSTQGSQLFTRPILASRITMSFLGDPVGEEDALEPRTMRVLTTLARRGRVSQSGVRSGRATPRRSHSEANHEVESTRSRRSRGTTLGSLCFACPGIAIDDARTHHVVRQLLVAQSAACGFDRALVVPSMNASELHAEMLAAILSPHIR